MKKGLLLLALCAFAFTGVQAQSTPPTGESTEISQDQDRVRIAPDDLPQAVRNAISEKEDVRDLRIAEAYQITSPEGELHYEVHFDKEGEMVSKKYDAQGNEVEED